MGNGFFEEQREQSLIKSRIVSKYFSAWANVILATQKRYPQHAQSMAYVDLFAGLGRYNDQSKSTPILVLETILNNPELSNRVINSMIKIRVILQTSDRLSHQLMVLIC